MKKALLRESLTQLCHPPLSNYMISCGDSRKRQGREKSACEARAGRRR